ncbi:F-box/FBD/LRR-repeat protein [Camellia lanceoleosa]|uniref:F-box/FBD/LRR-repeat protein n=1 Tax=Camellia lanceoleosa TaxID=1840588 RepID=A0ACC0H6C7_9ERIC|nr:F-box/FBD/LRR-repeat protein [Camellia lanceoleosa]
MDSDIGKSEDKISKLPDALLCHILSFLPTKYSVGTSALSTRWQYLWTSVPNFDFDESVNFHEYALLSKRRQKEVDLSFEDFVNRVLLLSDAPCFQKFHLNIGSLRLLALVDTWISAAIKRNVQDLELTNMYDINVRLPIKLFTSKTLVVLTLSGVFLDIPVSVLLPSLKSLKLDSVEFGDEDSLQEFLIGCPILENLFIERWVVDKQGVLNVSVPMLKRLMIICYRDDFLDQMDDPNESDDQGCKLMIDAPQLEDLYLADYVSEVFLLRNLPSLSKVSFFVGSTRLRRRSFTDDGLRMHKLLNGIPNVKFLDANFTCQTDVNDYMLPTFHNLTQLKFGADFDTSWNLKLLADFLRCSPYLEVLILTGSRFSDTAKCWNPPQEVPSCLLLCLKKIQIKEFSGKDYELDVIEYLLSNAKVLKNMTINCQYTNDCFCGELAAFPRGSKTCQLNLLH